MNKIIITTLLLGLSSLAIAKTKYVPLDIKTGMWTYTTDLGNSDMMKEALKNVPAAQREMVKKMMASKNSFIKPQMHCITEAELKDAEKQFNKGYSKNKGMKDCKMVVVKSSAKQFLGKMVCKDKKQSMAMGVNVIDSKNTVTKVKGSFANPGGKPSTIKIKGKWVSSSCKK